jgi:thiol-disulfide isomerase/thioredoxin
LCYQAIPVRGTGLYGVAKRWQPDLNLKDIMTHITKFITGIFCITALFLPAWASAAELRETTGNKAAPPLELADLNDRQHSLGEYTGKVLLVNFWASWCHPCLQEIPELINLGKRLADQPFAIIAVNVGEEKRKLPGFTKKMAEHMVMLLDPDSTAFERWEGIGLPSSFVLDGTGRMHFEAYGPVNWDADEIVNAFEQLMREIAVTTGSRDTAE